MMMLESLSFGPFRIESHQLWRGEQASPLRPKALAVLRYLASQPERLVSQAELLSAVWPDTVVTSTALKVCIREIRAVLGERAQRPHFIETLGQRGYRFIAPVASDEFGDSRSLSSPAPMAGPEGSPSPPQPAVLRPQPSLLAGREPELAQLQQSWETVRSGERQVVLVTGEAGIGKTALVTGFVGQLQETQPVLLARGQCVERYGAGEAYLPMLEAVGRLCRETQSLSGWLRRFAPSWLLQLPALLAVAERETLQRQVGGLPPERMLRELAEAVEILTAEQPLVLVLEDLHWSDPSTLELVSYLAQRQERARLLILGTYRVAEAAQKGRRVTELKQVLQVHGQCQELWLGPLPEATVTQYVAQQLESEGQATDLVQSLAQLLWQRTEGNPLFVVNLLAELLRQGFVAQMTGQWQLRREGVELSHDIPDSLQQLIEQQVESVSDVAKPVLEVASVVGVEFGTASVAAGVPAATEAVEGQCEELVAREHIVAAQGAEEWPDGTFSARYTFRHGMYQEVLYAGLSAARRVWLHRQIGERKEAGYGERAVEIAAELAVHFEQGREYSRAVQYRQQAGEVALARSAYQEAEAHCRQGLGLLLTLLTTQECRQQELRLQITLGTVLLSTQGYAAPEVEQRYRRARVLCKEVGETPQLCSTLYKILAFYKVRGELQTAAALAEQLLQVAQRSPETVPLLAAYSCLGQVTVWQGEFDRARQHAADSLAHWDPTQTNTLIACYGEDLAQVTFEDEALTLWVQGYPDQARQRSEEGLSWAQAVAHPFSLASTHFWVTMFHQLCQNQDMTHTQAEVGLALAAKYSFPVWEAACKTLQGWALAAQGQVEAGLAQLHAGMEVIQTLGIGFIQTYFYGLLAEAYGKAGQVEEGLTVVAEALADAAARGERFYEAELYRLKGELLFQGQGQGPKAQVRKRSQAKVQGFTCKASTPQPLPPNPQLAAEECFQRAVSIAQQQGAKSFELRAVMSLGRLWQRQGKTGEAWQLLAELYDWFTEGFETVDLQDAKALLAEWAFVRQNAEPRSALSKERPYAIGL